MDALSPDAPVSPLGQSARSASAAWIKSASLSNGHALVGYDQEGSAAWGHSADWSLSSPTWDAHRWDDPPPFGWPPPENFCALYDCDLGAVWASYNTTAQVLWTGLDDVAVAVATGGPMRNANADVVLLSSTDGGQTFTQAQILSIPTPAGDAGGDLIESTVHASLMYTPERTNAKAGTTSTRKAPPGFGSSRRRRGGSKRPVAHWDRVYVAPSADPFKGAPIADAWGQSIAISQGSSAQPAVVAAVWRNADLSGRVAMAAASSILFGDLGSWITTGLTSGAGVPWEAAGDMGLHTGTAALQVCIHGTCPGAPAAYPKIPFFSSWADERSSGANPEIWAKAFTP